MQADQLRGAMHKTPFRPFVIRTASGERYPVPHPDMISISPSGRTVGVWSETLEDIAIIDMEAITKFVASSSQRSTKRSK